jgi:putative nucleotidyltransferase with HDIG domain
MNNFKLEKVIEDSIGWWIVADVSVIVIIYILKNIFKSASLENWYNQLDSHDFLYKQALHIEVKEQELATRNEVTKKPEEVIKHKAVTEEVVRPQDVDKKEEQLKETIVENDKERLNKALIAATASDATLLDQMKSESEKLYLHSMVIANLSKRAARSIGANENLAYAGGWYHEIGRLTGKDYVPNGVALIQEHHLPSEIADIILQHTFKEQLPQTKEAVIVMLSDNIISTIQYVKNRMETQITAEKVIENTFTVRMNKGILNEANMTIAEFTKLKEFYLSVVEELR